MHGFSIYGVVFYGFGKLGFFFVAVCIFGFMVAYGVCVLQDVGGSVYIF